MGPSDPGAHSGIDTIVAKNGRERSARGRVILVVLAQTLLAAQVAAADLEGPDPTAAHSEPPLVTERDRVLYAIGVRTAHGLRDYALRPD